MSVLVIGAREDQGAMVIRRLVDQGDDVRLIEHDLRRAERWRELGAHTARGSADDVDLVERAAQHVRTIVVMDDAAGSIDTIVAGAAAARVGRIVVWSRQTAGVASLLRTTSMEWVVMRTPRRRLLGRAPGVSPQLAAEAIDAADDLSGPVHLELDLSDPAAWTALGLDAPH